MAATYKGILARKLIAIVGLVLLLPGMANAVVNVDSVVVGDPAHTCDTQPQSCFGAVADSYRISKCETTNAQYAEFLNAVAKTDTNELFSW